ncbi:MAG TPA: winged helix DNA-binding domain-containing protein, partial [Micromonosporaceae bacterium]|nr:winged helix DNA-binding domain-containing protein [Micromonosporaceae bacterium]
DRAEGSPAETAMLDIGVQDTGPDGGLWALRNRGVDVAMLPERELALLWSVRGAPHLYRREDLPSIVAAVEPFSDADAGKRIFDAAKPLKAAGIANLAGLDAVAAAMRSVVTGPMVKGEVSARLTALMPAPYLRYCRPCDATHLYEMPFRLAALRAGLELQAGTSPPVLQHIPEFEPAARAPQRFDLIRTYLRLLGPATPKHVADYLDAPVKDVKARWPADAVEVSVSGETRWVLASDRDRLDGPQVRGVRLLGPYDLYLQAKDRPLLIDDPTRAKALWPVLGRPGAVLAHGEIVGLWRPRKLGAKLTVQVQLWAKTSRAAVSEQAERLAEHRRAKLAKIDFVD